MIANSEPSVTNSQHPIANSGPSVANSQHLIANSEASIANSRHSIANSEHTPEFSTSFCPLWHAIKNDCHHSGYIGNQRTLRDGLQHNQNNLKPRFFLDLMENQAELPSPSEIAGMNVIELEEIVKSTEDLIFKINNQSQTDEPFEHPLRDLLGLDKQLRSIRGSLKAEVAKRFSWKNTSLKSIKTSRESENILENTMMAFEKTSPSELMI